MKTIFLFFQNFNPSGRNYATPHDSTQGMSPDLQIILLGLTFMFGLYIVFRVRKMIDEDAKK